MSTPDVPGRTRRPRGDVGDQVRSATRHEPADEVQRAHLRALHAAVSVRPAAAAAGSTWEAVGSTWQRRVAVGATAGLLLVPGAAIAAEGTTPGHPLYPLKRATEPLRSLVDPDVVARHRLEELVALLDDEAAIDRLEQALREARSAVADDSDLAARLAELEARLAPDDDASDRDADTTEAPTDADVSPDDEPDDDATTATGDEDTDDEPSVEDGDRSERPKPDDEDSDDEDADQRDDDSDDEDSDDGDSDDGDDRRARPRR